MTHPLSNINKIIPQLQPPNYQLSTAGILHGLCLGVIKVLQNPVPLHKHEASDNQCIQPCKTDRLYVDIIMLMSTYSYGDE